MPRRPSLTRRAMTVALSLATALALVPAGPAAGAACPDPAGDADRFRPTADGDLVFATLGHGQGLGLSQEAAQGAALLGCDHETILATSYPGTRIDKHEPLDEVRVGLATRRQVTHVAATGGDVTWRNDDDPNADPGTSSQVGTAFTQPEGTTYAVTVADDGAFVVTDLATDTEVWRGGDERSLLSARHDGTVVDVTAFGDRPGDELERTFRWGRTEFDSRGAATNELFTFQVVTPASDGTSAVERYLRGVAEVSSDREPAALRAQAIASRTFLHRTAAARSGLEGCRCDVLGNESGQVYGGWTQERDDQAGGGQWADAVAATRDQVLTYQGEVIDARFGASHGGVSTTRATVEANPDLPYLREVNVAAWERSSEGLLPGAFGFSLAELTARLGPALDLDTVAHVEIDSVGPGGRPSRDPGGVLVTGQRSGSEATERISGARLADLLGLRSARFIIAERATDRAGVSTSLACPENEVPEDGFSDVPENGQFEDEIDCMAWWNVVRGTSDTTYGPDSPVNRAQMATMIANTLERAGVKLPVDAPDAFSDDDGSPHEPNIDRLAALEIVSGTSPGVYDPAADVTRAQMATFLRRSYELAAGSRLPWGDGSFPDDDGSAHEESIDAVAVAYIVLGRSDGEFDPGESVSRQHLATFVARLLDVLVERGAAEPPS